jgi:hypothetical protein
MKIWKGIKLINVNKIFFEKYKYTIKILHLLINFFFTGTEGYVIVSILHHLSGYLVFTHPNPVKKKLINKCKILIVYLYFSKNILFTSISLIPFYISAGAKADWGLRYRFYS